MHVIKLQLSQLDVFAPSMRLWLRSCRLFDKTSKQRLQCFIISLFWCLYTLHCWLLTTCEICTEFSSTLYDYFTFVKTLSALHCLKQFYNSIAYQCQRCIG